VYVRGMNAMVWNVHRGGAYLIRGICFWLGLECEQKIDRVSELHLHTS
jgi:hypothetical protein